MDIVLGDYGESVAAGNCTSGANDKQSHVIAIGAAITRTKTVMDGETFDLNIFELVLDEDDPSHCGLVKRLSTPWTEKEPTTLQLWNNPTAARSFTLAVTSTSTSTSSNESFEAGQTANELLSVGTVTLTELTAIHNEESQPSSSAAEFVSLGRSVSFVTSASSWTLSSKMTLPVVFNHIVANKNKNMHQSQNPIHASPVKVPSSGSSASVTPVTDKWELLTCPLLEGGKHLLFKNANKCREVCIVRLSEGELPDALSSVCPLPTPPGEEFSTEQDNSLEESAKSLSHYGKFMQNIPFNEDVTWAKFLDKSTVQIGVGNKWYIYSLFADSTDMWMLHSEPAIFNGIHSPEALSLNAVSSPNPWSNGHFASVPDHAKRGLVTSNCPDWHPLYVALDLFSLSSVSRGVHVNALEKTSLEGLPPLLHSLARGLYTSVCRLGLLANAMEAAQENVYRSYATKLLNHEHLVTKNLNFDALFKNMNAISRNILADAKSSKSSHVLGHPCYSPPLQLLRPCDIVFLSVLGSTFRDMLATDSVFSLSASSSDVEKVLGAMDVSVFADMDAWAMQSFLSFKAIGYLDQLESQEAEEDEKKEGEETPTPPPNTTSYTRVSGDVVLNALVSSTQDQLYARFIGSDADQFTTSLADRPQNKKEFNFSMLWWARNQAGKADANDYDILGSLAGVMAPVWLHDLTPVYDLIEKLSTAQFRDHRDSLKIFLEMVVTQKTDKLLQLAKTDRNIMGKQLLQLLGMDFKTAKGRQACHKNAFALLRLQRYKHAAAVFLCAEPPLLKEAVRVIIKHLKDPVLALLIARLVERRADAKPLPGGHILGTISRSIIEKDILPALYANIRMGGANQTDKEVNIQDKKNPFAQHWGVDAGMLAISCSMWLQDVEKLQTTIQLCSQCDIFRFSPTCSPYGVVKQLIGSCSSMKWLMKQTISPQSRVGFAGAFDSMLQQADLTDLRYMGQDFVKQAEDHNLTPGDSDPIKSFTNFCQEDLVLWKQKVHAYNRQQGQSEEERRQAANVEPEFEDVSAAMKKLQSIATLQDDEDTGNVVQTAQTLQKQSKGFNLSMSTSSASTSSASASATGDSSSGSALDMYGGPPPKPKPKAEPNNMLDMYGGPPPKPTPKAEPSNMLDMYGGPPPKPTPKAEPNNMLDMYGGPPPKPTPKAEPSNMLDMYGGPPPKPTPKAEPSNMLDMYGGPPPKPTPKAEPNNMLDMYGGPPPKPTPKAEPNNMLDMYGGPPPKPTPKAEPNNMLDMYGGPPPKPKPKAEPNNMLDMFGGPPPKPKPKVEVEEAVDLNISGNI